MMTFLIWLSFFFFICISSESVPLTSGFYTGYLKNVTDKFEIVYPERISKDGSFVSYYLPHYYNIEPFENRPRRHPGEARSSETGEIHFYIPIEGKNYHLKLWPNWNFLAPGLVIEKRDATNVQNINEARIKQVSKRQCHYSGEIVGQPNSNVALSACYGLAGYIRVPEVDEYFIEPLKDSKPTSDKEHPHVIYKRSDIKDKSLGSNCLTKGKAKEALNERMQWEALFRDHVHEELSEINVNELVRQSVNPTPEVISLKLNSLNNKFPRKKKFSFDHDFCQNNHKIETNYMITKQLQQNTHFCKPQLTKNFTTNNLSQLNKINEETKQNTDTKLKNYLLREEINVGSLKCPKDDLEVLPKSTFETRQLRSYHSTNGNKTWINGQIISSPEQKVLKRTLNSTHKLLNYDLQNLSDISLNNDETYSKFPNSKAVVKKSENVLANKIYHNEKIGKSAIAFENEYSVNMKKYQKNLNSKPLSKDSKVSSRSHQRHNHNVECIFKNRNIDNNNKLSKQPENNIRDNNHQITHHYHTNDVSLNNNLNVEPHKFTNTVGNSQNKAGSNIFCLSNKLDNEFSPSKLNEMNNLNFNYKNQKVVSSFQPLAKNVDGLKVKKGTNNIIASGNEVTRGKNNQKNPEKSNCSKSCETLGKFNKKESKNVINNGLIMEEESSSYGNIERMDVQGIPLIEVKTRENINVTAEVNKPGIIVGDINNNCETQRKLEKTMPDPEISNVAFARSDHQEESKYGSNNASSSNSNDKHLNKRQVWPDDCSFERTTEQNLLCFDFFNKVFNLELMITVDYKVVKMHSEDDIENFILTVINMVSANFYDKSLGINLGVFLVRLILLTTCIKELDSDRFNPEELLENFCTWQVLINPGKDDHPHHHDLAIFVTRLDKCEGQIMGVTYMTSICRPDKSCIVCVDEGLLLANTITHQIGHALGAEHDESESSGCPGVTPDGMSFHMAPTITESSSAWSVCSKDAMTQFVKSQGSWCLTDLPVERQFNFPLTLPGQIYSASQQCKLNFHMTAIPCLIGPFCEKLYCQVTEKLCATKGDPPADGTFCASDMWCFHKQCVHTGRRPGAVSGEWGPWTEWSLCTRSCGGGVASSYRICNNPKPENGGRYCIGERIRHKMCHTKSCQGFTESFRDFQCKKTEDRPFRGRLHNWIQYHSFFINIECSLICQNRKGEVVMRSPIVADGTPCKAGTRNVCIQGMCRNVGCDWVIDSMAKEDACGVCQGNGTECRIVHGSFDESATRKGLVEFLRIPKNSGMIFVREIAASANVIVVSGAVNRVFYVNGQGTEDTMPGDITLGLTHGVYEVRSGMDRVFIRGPTTEDLVFYVQFQEPNKGVHYQYALPEVDPTYVPRYLWQFIDWDSCTDPCSGGAQRAHAKCVEDRAGVVDDKYCSDSTRLMDIIRPCNDFPCQAKWWVSVWSDCICTSSSSVMFRSVLCMRATDESGTRSEVVKESECAAHKKPPTQKPCNSTDYQDECVIKRSVFKNGYNRLNRNIKREIISNISLKSAPNTKSLHNSQLQDNANNKEVKASLNSIDSKNKYSHSQAFKQNPGLNESSQGNGIEKTACLKNANSIEEKPYFAINSNLTEFTPDTKDSLLVEAKDNQVVNFNSFPKAFQKSNVEYMNTSFSGKENDIASDSNCQSSDHAEKMCETCQTTCPPLPPETTEAVTCRQTCPVQSHKKTICCKPRPSFPCAKPSETTTIRPLVLETDELNMNNFALSIVPLDIPKQKKLPQTDPEFINLGNLGEFGVGDEANGTIITGQEALDLLNFARRSNASEEAVAHHEDMHS